MTKVFFVRHAEPNYDNHDDRSLELSPRGMEDRKKLCGHQTPFCVIDNKCTKGEDVL